MSVCTRREHIDAVRAAFNGVIDLDPCDHPDSIVGALQAYRLPENDGLRASWFGRVYVNPPWGYDYLTVGETVTKWLARCAFMRRARYCECIAHVPTAPHTHYWDDYVYPIASAICFAREPSILESRYGALGPVQTSFVYYGSAHENFARAFDPIGPVVFVYQSRKAWTK